MPPGEMGLDVLLRCHLLIQTNATGEVTGRTYRNLLGKTQGRRTCVRAIHLSRAHREAAVAQRLVVAVPITTLAG